MNPNLKFKTKCAACGKSRRKEALLYDTATFQPYCSNFGICNDDNHPNSYKNFEARGNKLVELIPFKEASEKYLNRLLETATPRELEILKMTQKPTSVRIQDYEIAEHVKNVMEDKNLSISSFTDAISYIIRDHRRLVQGENSESSPVVALVADTPKKQKAKAKPEPEPEVKQEDSDIDTF